MVSRKIVALAAIALVPLAGCGSSDKQTTHYATNLTGYENEIQVEMDRQLAKAGSKNNGKINSVACVQKSARTLSCIAKGTDAEGPATVHVRATLSGGDVHWRVVKFDRLRRVVG